MVYCKKKRAGGENKVKNIEEICCPDCGAKDFEELYSMTTCVGWTPRYVNGKLVNKNPNHVTTAFKCCICGKTWGENDVDFLSAENKAIDC